MTIYVDSDSCPRQVRELVIRASGRTGIHAFFVANRIIPGIEGQTVHMELCPQGIGEADDRIVKLAKSGDLVLTRDIPLAARLVEGNIRVLDDRGRVFTSENIREKLSMRNFVVGLAESGMEIVRNPAYSKKELKAFADSFDRQLSQLLREEKA